MTGMLTMVLDPCKMVKVCNTFDAGNDVILVDQDSEVLLPIAVVPFIARTLSFSIPLAVKYCDGTEALPISYDVMVTVILVCVGSVILEVD